MAGRQRIRAHQRTLLAVAAAGALVFGAAPLAAVSAEGPTARTVNGLDVTARVKAVAEPGNPGEEEGAGVTVQTPFVESVTDTVTGSAVELTASSRANVTLAPVAGGDVTTSGGISDFSEGFTMTIEGSIIAKGHDALAEMSMFTSAFNVQEESVPWSVTGTVTMNNSVNGCSQVLFTALIQAATFFEERCGVDDVVPLSGGGLLSPGESQSFALALDADGGFEPDAGTTDAQADFFVRITVGGGACTVTGTPDPDELVGTSGPDVICGLGGDDTITGGGGDDVLAGGPGDDDLLGDAGGDALFGGPGTDRMNGGPGNDTLIGGTGPDNVRGGAGGDEIAGCGGEDVIDGGGGADTVRGAQDPTTDGDAAAPSGIDPADVDCDGRGDQANNLRGGAGADRLTGGPAGDTITGGGGSDVLSGQRGNDTLNARDRTSDRVNGGPGRDSARTDSGDVTSSIEVILRAR